MTRVIRVIRVDPSDDCTTRYVGDTSRGAASYSSKIGTFRMAGCR